jgi:UDP-3-O-[3-hydroxymyristoyl] glucosamine N-acyltransferase
VNHADWNKSAALLRNIDKLRDRIRALESAAADGSGSAEPRTAGNTATNAAANAASNSAGDKV